MDFTVQNLLLSGAQLTDAALERLLPSPDSLPHSIHRAMRHSTFAGGKRLRPIFCMEAARMVSGGKNIPDGAADLGQPTCHVVFGEAIAILAGDSLQTLAFQTIAALPTPPATTVTILREVSLAIGTGVGPNSPLPPGMIGGQVVDIESEGKQPTAELVESIHRAKTGALITTSIVSGGLYGLGKNPGAPHIDSDVWVHRLRTFGEKAGLAFQIVDDVLDMTQSSEELGKTAGKDTASIKATWPAVYGIDQSLKDAEQLIADAFEALAPFGEAATPLKSLAAYLVERKH
jgi:geranylgeranyl diphosphate synthase type II